MKCPECKHPAVVVDKRPIQHAGKILFAKTCEKCNWTWSDEVSPAEAAAPAPTPSADAPVEPADDGEPQFIGEKDGFDVEDVADGDRIRAIYKGEDVEATVNSVTEKTVLCEIDEEPDIRISKTNILGRFV